MQTQRTTVPRFPRMGTVLLDKYRVDSLIGEGGMGVVLKAHHLELDEPVAIKCLLPDMMSRADIVQRFMREAKAAVKLKGEHVARVSDVGRLETGVPYIVMEYLEGADLNAIIKHHGSQDPAISVDLMLQACEAIAEAHSLGIIHRDIKASNFFISQPEGQAPILKVLDFGIATAPEGASDLTSTQSVIGTPSYMAPEQMRSSRTADARSDIWSMGVVLYELVEGARPFRSDVYSDLCLKVGMDPPSPITNPEVPEGLIAVVLKCLEKPVDRRYQSVAELAFDLMPFASDAVVARALVEQCARLLGRRATKMFQAAVERGPNDSTPIPPMPTPPRLTPHSPHSAQMAVPADAIAQLTPPNRTGSQPSLLGKPTPVPSAQPKTPTSIQQSRGQLAMSPSRAMPSVQRPYSGPKIALVLGTILALGAAGVYVARDRFGASDDVETVTPAAPPVQSKVVTPAVTATKPAVTATKPAVTETKPVVTETKPAVTETKPAVTETKPAVTETKPAVTETKPAVTETKPSVTETRPAATKPVVTRTVTKTVTKPAAVTVKKQDTKAPPPPPPPKDKKDDEMFRHRQ